MGCSETKLGHAKGVAVGILVGIATLGRAVREDTYWRDGISKKNVSPVWEPARPNPHITRQMSTLKGHIFRDRQWLAAASLEMGMGSACRSARLSGKEIETFALR